MRLADGLWLSKRKTWLFALLSILGLVGCAQDGASENTQQRPLPQVKVMTAQKTNETAVFGTYPARVHGSKQVQVRARIEGILKEKRYQEGRFVDRGEVLFVIDPEPFEIAHRRAMAELSDARANHDHALREWNRHSKLYAQNAVSERERDQSLTSHDLAKARLSMAEAALDDARRNLGYTEVRAPVAGVTGMEDVSEGNLISWGGLLTTLTRNDPVHVRFSLPEIDALDRALFINQQSRENQDDIFQAELIFPDGQRLSRSGNIDFTSSTVDPATGTVGARAVFPNPDHLLLPGQFVRIRILLQKLDDVFVIPEEAVIQGREGPGVFVVNEEDVAGFRRVRLGPVVEEGQVVFDGFEQGHRIVINGQVALRDGVPVSVIEEGGR